MALPTYQELADIVCALAEMNIANIDSPKDRWVSCFTFETGKASEQWHRAIKARETLIASRIVPRTVRREHSPSRSMRR